MTPVTQSDYIASLERDIALLREELWEQWESNHFEYCSREWPHPAGKLCHWPPPAVLLGGVQ